MRKFKTGDVVKLKGDKPNSPRKTVRCYAEDYPQVKEYIKLVEKNIALPKVVVCDWTTTGGGDHRQYYYEDQLESF